MAGSVRALIFLFVGALALPAWSQTATPAAASPAATPAKRQPGARQGLARNSPFDGTPSPEFENVSRALNDLNPEQRQRFQENFRRWASLSPDEKKALADREEIRKRIMQKDVETAIKETGLQLEGAQREEFAQKYGDERRKIEEQLRKEINEKRKPLIRDLIGRLKTEFSAPATVSSTPASTTPAPTPTTPPAVR